MGGQVKQEPDEVEIDTESLTAAVLAALGDTPEVVAWRLLLGGFRGWPGEADSCPVARYLNAHGIGGEVYPEIEESDEDSYQAAHVEIDDLMYPLPEAVDAFVRRFDLGGFPGLVDPMAREPAG